MTQPLVSVVVPSYNHAHFLPRALGSVQRQGWKNWEIVVVDNHSTDATDEVLAPWLNDQIRVIKIHNQGIIAASRNLGLRHARGEWIAFLDSDDWWTDDKLEGSMTLAMQSADVVYHDLQMVGLDGKQLPWRRSRSHALGTRNTYDDLRRDGCALPNSSVVARKSRLDAIGGLREEADLVGWEDYDTWLRLAEDGCRFARLPGVHGYYWVGGGSVSNPRRTLANIDAFIARHAGGKAESTPWWCHYSRAVAYRLLGEADKVGPSFAAAWRARPSPINRMRIAAKWLLSQ
jgi:glycosyltransferase involved in cell wall biosynthesis